MISGGQSSCSNHDLHHDEDLSPADTAALLVAGPAAGLNLKLMREIQEKKRPVLSSPLTSNCQCAFEQGT